VLFHCVKALQSLRLQDIRVMMLDVICHKLIFRGRSKHLATCARPGAADVLANDAANVFVTVVTPVLLRNLMLLWFQVQSQRPIFCLACCPYLTRVYAGRSPHHTANAHTHTDQTPTPVHEHLASSMQASTNVGGLAAKQAGRQTHL